MLLASYKQCCTLPRERAATDARSDEDEMKDSANESRTLTSRSAVLNRSFQ